MESIYYVPASPCCHLLRALTSMFAAPGVCSLSLSVSLTLTLCFQLFNIVSSADPNSLARERAGSFKTGEKIEESQRNDVYGNNAQEEYYGIEDKSSHVQHETLEDVFWKVQHKYTSVFTNIIVLFSVLFFCLLDLSSFAY